MSPALMDFSQIGKKFKREQRSLYLENSDIKGNTLFFQIQNTEEEVKNLFTLIFKPSLKPDFSCLIISWRDNLTLQSDQFSPRGNRFHVSVCQGLPEHLGASSLRFGGGGGLYDILKTLRKYCSEPWMEVHSRNDFTFMLCSLPQVI